jgi:hypothetical protein
MTDETENTPPSLAPTTPESEPKSKPLSQQELARRQKLLITAIIAGGIILIVGFLFIFWVLLQPGIPTDRIRDIFVIFLALETLLVGIAVIILMVQVATLVNLIQNEVRPMLESTNETINTLRGTTEFLSENLVEPVIQLNGYLASLQRMLELMGLKRK